MKKQNKLQAKALEASRRLKEVEPRLKFHRERWSFFRQHLEFFPGDLIRVTQPGEHFGREGIIDRPLNKQWVVYLEGNSGEGESFKGSELELLKEDRSIMDHEGKDQ